ncbi:Aste57867_15948 [Aphanomyces stellatus]|uniref:Aste57867_15948 protein n=1 Tax=Aphanomyces stellatus TaxID=120398 RepID=A0A485L4A4_9STRA|nr:hypothetical protein As57867_015892 [Aphanomyces stellatus]VFT92734.1 Aste57867_15948 [Aphanomyces stellatus]
MLVRALVGAAVLFALAAADTSKRCPGSPNQCSLHGSCMINRHGDYVCNCQWGWTGFDCGQKMCPHGFDPLASGEQESKKLRLTILRTPPSSAPLTGTLLLQFHGHVVEMELPHLTNELCTQIFRRFRNLGELSCTRVGETSATPTAAVHEFDITLHSFPVYPIMNNLFYHAGNPPSSDFSCDASNIPGVSCRFTSDESSSSSSTVKAYVPCSNHGVCNVHSGLCACEAGFHGVHCGSNEDAADIVHGLAPGPFFSGNLLKLSAARRPSTSFNLMHVDVGGHPVFTMDGEGHTRLHDGGSLAAPRVLTSVLDVAHGHVSIVDADVKIIDGRVALAHTTGALAAPLLQLDVTSPTCSSDLLRLSLGGSTVFQVDATGDTSLDSLDVRNHVHVGGSLVVAKPSRFQGTTTFQDRVEALHHVHVGAGLDVHGPMVLQSGAGAASVGQHDAAAFVTLQVRGGDVGQHVVAAYADETPLVEIARSGATTIHQGGVDVRGGGVHVHAGGVAIDSGGLHIRAGGLQIDAGAVELHDTLVLTEGLDVRSTETNQATLRAHATHGHFTGSVLALEASPAAQDTPFDFLVATQGNDTVARVGRDGYLWTRGSVTSAGDVTAQGALVADRRALWRPRTLKMQPTLTIPCTHSYVHITDDGISTPTTSQVIDVVGAATGQLLVVQNDDGDALQSLKIPPHASALFVFDGQRWQTLTATEFDTTSLRHVHELTAAANLNIGEFQLTAQSIQVGGQPAGRVALYGKGGVLAHDPSFTFDATTSTLHVREMQVDQLTGKIDMTNSELRGVDIIGGFIRGINMSALLLEVTGEMYVESNAYVGGGLVVDGQVMGSGSYVDSSDARFKTNISTIPHAVDTLQQLRGVEFDFDVAAFPTKHFSTRRQLGFIAQEVEAVLPHVVTTDVDGFKYIAYAHVVPVVVEALKTQADDIAALQATVATLNHKMERLEALLMDVLSTAKTTD